MKPTIQKRVPSKKSKFGELLRTADTVENGTATIRKARLQDFKFIRRQLVDFGAFHMKHEPELFSDKMVAQKEISDYYRSALRNNDSSLMVAEKHGTVAGFIKFDFETISDIFRDNTVLYVDCIYVDGRFRRNGIAKAMMNSVEEIAKAKKIGRIQLRVYAFNREMQSLLKSMDYRSPHATWDKVVNH